MSPAWVSMIGNRGEAASALLGRELGGALEQAAVEVEDVAGIRLAAGWAAKDERDLAVSRGVLRKVVVHAQRVLAVVAEVLAHGRARIGGEIEEGSGVGGGGRDHDGVIHGPEVFEGLHHLRHRRPLLADGDVDADDAFALLVDDGVDGHRGFAGLAVADDEFALAAADVDHGVDGLDAGFEGFAHGLPVDHAGGDDFDFAETRGGDRALAVDGFADGVDHPAHEFRADGNGHDARGAAYFIALADQGVVAQENRAHRILFEVQGHAPDAVGEIEQFAGHAVGESMDPRDAVTDGENGSDLGGVGARGETRELLL